MTLAQLLNHFSGHVFECSCEGTVDYRGTNPDEALLSLNACEEMWLRIFITDTNYCLGTVFVVDGEIADYSMTGEVALVLG